jgi:hypothetical protein
MSGVVVALAKLSHFVTQPIKLQTVYLKSTLQQKHPKFSFVDARIQTTAHSVTEPIINYKKLSFKYLSSWVDSNKK